jgi:Fe-Mn family superoxide dismutase
MISAETLSFHYDKHHRKYVDTLNQLTEGGELAGKSLEEIIKTADGPVFNNAAQTFNHSFYWNSLSPDGGGSPSGAIATAIDSSFGSFENFQKEFTQAAATHFGSGWVWLVKNPDGSLAVEQTHDAGCPLTTGKTPILTCDVWEHAYYIDYRNLRPNYIEAWWKLLNWDFANSNL